MPLSLVFSRGLAAICLFALLSGAATAEERKGVLGFLRASSKTPAAIELDARSGAMATARASSGPMAKACDVRGKALGKVVEKGPGKWKLHDTAPGSTTRRAFYLTGFSDGCPRRLDGAVAMFGSVELYELVHYGPVGIKPTQAEVDRTYAKLRSKVCGSSGRACKERGVRKLSKQAVFVDVYASAEGSSRVQLLMNRGKLAAMSQK
ncbi:hypothetical protein R3X27_06475 [Tropicimonas sp. TH_r6]|uniref:hypothetical protein n=1 Tax=Tropicimonas sp. TH_r6 TaxID=3082085 RepID=UPI0029551B02|nr:hypothetical protein [Tropicimonas sp. TH_r6]MDV7142322.1 hypothetical protein [Tropicimonas sp. TH_r6]